jgi:hypothetical protein
MKTYGKWRYSSTILEISTRWRLVVKFTPLPLYRSEKSPRYLSHRRLFWPQNRSGRYREEKTLAPSRNITSAVQSVIILTELSRFLLSSLSGRLRKVRRGEHWMWISRKSILGLLKYYIGNEESIFCDIIPWSPLKVNRHFGETCRLHFQGPRLSVDCHRATKLYIPEDRKLHNHRCENTKTYIIKTSWVQECNKNVEDKKFTQSFGRNVWRQKTIWKT